MRGASLRRENPNASQNCPGTRLTQREQALREGDEHLRKTVAELEASRQDLQEKITELERFHDVTVGCELKMIEMEKEIVHLREEDAVLKLKAKTQSSQDC